jgi:hypothetical protein
MYFDGSSCEHAEFKIAIFDGDGLQWVVGLINVIDAPPQYPKSALSRLMDHPASAS